MWIEGIGMWTSLGASHWLRLCPFNSEPHFIHMENRV